ncbi:MAG: hypothetical protein GOMPHAMPRED_004195 [Gomphillus americanus]|uniref:Uncharacterized protein n=1 Tax=Gomphillus americanus TaxID=1940652 RepID=A0A8H3IFZ8_9LECA|nr:MAG: hypothetical protein GOMPHAMPRED_004195 [Gomphillus americanus]
MQTLTLLSLALLPVATLAQNADLYARYFDLAASDDLDVSLQARDADPWAYSDVDIDDLFARSDDEELSTIYARELLDDDEFLNMLLARDTLTPIPKGHLVADEAMHNLAENSQQARLEAFQNTVKAGNWHHRKVNAQYDHQAHGHSDAPLRIAKAMHNHYSKAAGNAAAQRDAPAKLAAAGVQRVQRRGFE